jgi:SAM-dependent methyltransferase
MAIVPGSGRIMKQEIDFEKYRKHGAYHWQIYFGSLFKIDSFLRARYHVVIYLLKHSGISHSSALLEVGCGDGALSGLIYKKFRCQVTGIEPSSEGIRLCTEMFKAYGFKGTFERSEGYRFNFADSHFDLVVLADVIEHLQEPDLMLAEIRRVLKPGGKLIITTPIRTTEHPEDKMHVREFYPDELVDLCRRYFGDPIESIHTHPVVWYELYSFGKKFNRSLIRLFCRIMDRIFQHNVFFKEKKKSQWNNYKQQGLLLRKVV